MSKNTKTMICPFCDEELRFGVKVCRGCQAEITYEHERTFSSGHFVAFCIITYILFNFYKSIHSWGFWILIFLDIKFFAGIFPINPKAKPEAKFERRQFR
ncbi:hypothetical protein AVBRAN9333_08195 [Campylobacter sp. RM9333]|uniref:hypothetical protein n=1 Tax=unclassified Campylobacter TaxID=2593542 RepID=UPI001BDB518E|nr:hypothetical protein [Campylobacter sp. 2018MI13]MBT0882766.1 hypothetical protein [Campylobacter sp. 2018MI13]MBZ7993680.1 hypothetical protein [Campylobacter sp. RM9333]